MGERIQTTDNWNNTVCHDCFLISNQSIQSNLNLFDFFYFFPSLFLFRAYMSLRACEKQIDNTDWLNEHLPSSSSVRVGASATLTVEADETTVAIRLQVVECCWSVAKLNLSRRVHASLREVVKLSSQRRQQIVKNIVCVSLYRRRCWSFTFF